MFLKTLQINVGKLNFGKINFGKINFGKINFGKINVGKINVGKVCNQTCSHNHVDAAADRRESMLAARGRQIIEFLSRSNVSSLDITGGAPEMNPNFRMLVEVARWLRRADIDRCNLTISLANGFTDLPELLTEQQVNVVASLPCYLEEKCNAQPWDGVFDKSIAAISKPNQLGYGQPGSSLQLDLVYKPTGLGLPPAQQTWEADYKRELAERDGIMCNPLFTFTNTPVGRFPENLLQRQKHEEYVEKLIQHFNPSTVEKLMRRSLISIDWHPFLYDCDSSCGGTISSDLNLRLACCYGS